MNMKFTPFLSFFRDNEAFRRRVTKTLTNANDTAALLFVISFGYEAFIQSKEC